MNADSATFATISTKFVAAGVIVVCLLIGLAGLILPLIPGLLFLGVAAVVAARLSPRFARMVRQSPILRGYLERTEGFGNLALGEKLELAGLLILKAAIDGVAFLVSAVMKLMKAVERRA